MDKNKFEQLLRELAEVEQGLDCGVKHRRIETDNNTYPLRVIKLKDRPGACKDCGRITDNPPHRNLSYRGHGVWVERCAVCKFARQPDTGKFGPAVPKNSKAVKEIPWEPAGEIQSQSQTGSVVTTVYATEKDDSVPNQPQHQECQSATTENDSSEPVVVGYIEQVVVRECRESVIKEYSKIPVILLPDSNDAPRPDSEVRKD